MGFWLLLPESQGLRLGLLERRDQRRMRWTVTNSYKAWNVKSISKWHIWHVGNMSQVMDGFHFDKQDNNSLWRYLSRVVSLAVKNPDCMLLTTSSPTTACISHALLMELRSSYELDKTSPARVSKIFNMIDFKTRKNQTVRKHTKSTFLDFYNINIHYG